MDVVARSVDLHARRSSNGTPSSAKLEELLPAVVALEIKHPGNINSPISYAHSHWICAQSCVPSLKSLTLSLAVKSNALTKLKDSIQLTAKHWTAQTVSWMCMLKRWNEARIKLASPQDRLRNPDPSWKTLSTDIWTTLHSIDCSFINISVSVYRTFLSGINTEKSTSSLPVNRS